MPRYSRDPRTIRARFNSKCAETGKPINKGDECVYYPSSKQVFHMESTQAGKLKADQHDMAMEDLACDRMGYESHNY